MYICSFSSMFFWVAFINVFYTVFRTRFIVFSMQSVVVICSLCINTIKYLVACNPERLYICTHACLQACTPAPHASTPVLLHTRTSARLHSCTTARLNSYTSARLHFCTPALLHSYTPASLLSCMPALLRAYSPTLLHACTPVLIHAYTGACLYSVRLHSYTLARIMTSRRLLQWPTLLYASWRLGGYCNDRSCICLMVCHQTKTEGSRR